MKILAVDAGNTRIKWGYAEEGRWVHLSWVATAEASTLGVALAELPPADRAVVSNVAGAAAGEAIATALAPLQPVPLWITSAAQQCGVRSSYHDPGQLGSDRWAALIGAWHLFRGSCVVANVGTTMTVDALTSEGLFVGGLIVPGIELMRAALARNTAQLTMEKGRFTYFPDRTADAIMSGAINALAGAVERMARFMTETGEGDVLVVLSGGGAEMLAPQLNARNEVVDNLVLEGLARIALESR